MPSSWNPLPGTKSSGEGSEKGQKPSAPVECERRVAVQVEGGNQYLRELAIVGADL